MSLSKKKELSLIAKELCSLLRKNQTGAEKLLWTQLRNRKLAGIKFYRQYPIFYDLTGKESFFIADFFSPVKKLVIELDGEYHDYRLAHDKARTEIIELLGLKVLRFRNEIILNKPNEVINTILKEVHNNGE